MSPPGLHAPREHGQILAAPPLHEVGALLDRNRRSLTSSPLLLLGKSLDELRLLARHECLAASKQYHLEAGEPNPSSIGDAWLVAGHQPELFHPGVWYKNFELQHLAQQNRATAMNLVIDTDSAKPAILHAPADGRLARIPFDRSTSEKPYEERAVEDEETFASFPDRMAPIISHWSFEPMLASFWNEVMKQSARTPLLGERIAAARRKVERRWGFTPRELPMSRVCQTEAFAWFACAIVSDLPSFHAIYNRTVQDYRREHDIRSRSHPVPDLAVKGEWLEAPFWAWSKSSKRRGKLFVRRTQSTCLLRLEQEEWPSIPFGDPGRAIEAWRSLESHGFKVRTRALTTTLFTRLLLADVFIHGIGGGIYDALTDRLFENYMQLPAPGFLVLSVTLLLPLPRYPDADDRVRTMARRLRDLHYKPDLFVTPTLATEALIREKRDWIQRGGVTHAERVDRFEHIRALNAQLRPHVASQITSSEKDRAEIERQAQWDEVARRRDYGFCLYPEEMLQSFFRTKITPLAMPVRILPN